MSRLPRKLKKRIKKNRKAWAIEIMEAAAKYRRTGVVETPLCEFLRCYPMTPEQCFTWNIQGQKKGATN